jgi:hypothetical protein
MAARNLAVDHKRLAFARQLPARDHNRREPAVLLEGVGRDDLRDEFASGKTHNAAGRVAAETLPQGLIVGQPRVAIGGEPLLDGKGVAASSVDR